MNNFGSKLDVCSLQAHPGEPSELRGKGNDIQYCPWHTQQAALNTFYLYGRASTWGGTHIFIFSLTALNFVHVWERTPDRWQRRKPRSAVGSCFMTTTQCEKMSQEILSGVPCVIKHFTLTLTPRRERCFNPISSQEPTNPEILDILAKLIDICGLLLKNVFIHVNGLMMGLEEGRVSRWIGLDVFAFWAVSLNQNV